MGEPALTEWSVAEYSPSLSGSSNRKGAFNLIGNVTRQGEFYSFSLFSEGATQAGKKDLVRFMGYKRNRELTAWHVRIANDGV